MPRGWASRRSLIAKYRRLSHPLPPIFFRKSARCGRESPRGIGWPRGEDVAPPLDRMSASRGSWPERQPPVMQQGQPRARRVRIPPPYRPVPRTRIQPLQRLWPRMRARPLPVSSSDPCPEAVLRTASAYFAPVAPLAQQQQCWKPQQRFVQYLGNSRSPNGHRSAHCSSCRP